MNLGPEATINGKDWKDHTPPAGHCSLWAGLPAGPHAALLQGSVRFADPAWQSHPVEAMQNYFVEDSTGRGVQLCDTDLQEHDHAGV